MRTAEVVASGLVAISLATTEHDIYAAASALAMRLPTIDRVAVMRCDDRGRLSLAFTPRLVPMPPKKLVAAVTAFKHAQAAGTTPNFIDDAPDLLLVPMTRGSEIAGVLVVTGKGEELPAVSQVERVSLGAIAVAMRQATDNLRYQQWLQHSVPRSEHEQALDVARRLILRAVKSESQGYLLEDADPQDVRQAARLAASSELTSTGLKLSERETTLLWLLAAGYSNREISTELDLAESTVKNNLSALFHKLNVRDRTQAVLHAFAVGLVPRPVAGNRPHAGANHANGAVESHGG